MQVEFSEVLKPTLKEYENDLQVQGVFMSEKDIADRYLNRGFGNAYDFDQKDQLAVAI